MNLINSLVIVLAILPLFAVFTDMKEGKIKNYFIFPSFIFIIILSFFIEGFFFSNDNLLSIAIIILFGYMFYINNKWGAGDGKYFMLLWLSSIIIWYLKGETWLILKMITYTFILFLIFTITYLVKEFKNIKKIKFNHQKFNLINTFYSISILNIFSFFIVSYLPANYAYIIIFILLMVFIPIFENIKSKTVQILIIFSCLVLTIIYGTYISLGIVSVLFIIFKYIWNYIEQILDIIDIKTIKIIELQQWNILTKQAINKIKNDINKEFLVSPLQWNEVFDIIKWYKETKKDSELITIYKDIKIWIIMYIAYILTIVHIYLLR